MSGQIVRRLKPEDEELLRKREELAAVRAFLAELELELVDLRGQLAAFEGRYLRQVGVLYAELDEWKARLSELQARLDPSPASRADAEQAREQARQTHEDAHGEASKAPDFTPSPDLKKLYRDAAKLIHPDFSKDAVDLERRTRFMAEANRAYAMGDDETLQRILDEYQDGADAVEGEGVGAELIRLIRQISLAKSHVAAIKRELDIRPSASSAKPFSMPPTWLTQTASSAGRQLHSRFQRRSGSTNPKAQTKILSKLHPGVSQSR